MLSRSVCYLFRGILLVAAYLGAAWIGLAFAIPPGIATAVWPASGVALAAMLLLGMRFWPGVWLGALLANSVLTAVSPATAAAIATGNTCEALLAAWLCRRLLPPDGNFVPTRGRGFPVCGTSSWRIGAPGGWATWPA